MLELEAVRYCAAGRTLVEALDLQVRPGRLLALIGPNGAGKSTALGLLSGRLAPARGRATLDGQPLADWPAELLARRRAVLSQRVQLAFGFTAAEVVMLGRSMARGADDARIVAETLDAVCARHLASRSYLELSGGEQQRVQLARVLAQIWDVRDEPAYLLLDEPEAGLDIAHQHFILHVARDLARAGYGVAVVLHDLNLAARHADDVALMQHGRLVHCGATASALDPQRLSAVYDIALCRLAFGGGTLIAPQPDARFTPA